MSQEKNKQIYHPFPFHGTKTVANVSEPIFNVTGVGWAHVVSNSAGMYIGATGADSSALPMAAGETFPIMSSDLQRWFVSGNGSVSFAGAYSKN